MSVIASTLETRDWMDRARLMDGMPRSPAMGSESVSAPVLPGDATSGSEAL